MKRKIFIISLVIFCVVFFVFINIEKIDNRLTVMEFENAYQQDESEVVLTDLCYYLNDNLNVHSLDDKRIKYMKELIDRVSLDGIKQSKMFNIYAEYESELSPREFVILFYITDMLYAEKYDLFVEEFALYYLQVDYISTIYLQECIRTIYSKTEDVLILEYGKKAYEKIISITNDNTTKDICKVQIDILDEMKTDTQSQTQRTQGDGSVIDISTDNQSNN